MNKKAILAIFFAFHLFISGCITSSSGRKERIYSHEVTYSTYLSFALMRDYVKFGDYRGALRVYESFHGKKTVNLEFLAAYTLMKLGRYSEAAEKFFMLYKKGFLPDYSLYFAGLNYFKSGNFYVSKDLFELHLSSFPSSIFASEDRCLLTKITGKLGLRKVYEGDFPNSADCLYTRILSEKNRQRMVALVKDFLVTYPGHPYEEEILDRAGATVFTLLDLDSLKKRWERMIGRGEWKILKREARKYLKRTGDRGCYYYLLGKMRFRMKDYSSAARYFVKARKMRKNNCAEEVLYNLGRTYARLDRNNDSIKIFRTLLKKFPNTRFKEDTIYRLGLVYTYMKVTDSAISAFENYHLAYPSGKYIEDVLWKLAMYSYSRGNTTASISYLKELYEKGHRLRKAQSLYWRAKWDKSNREKYLKELLTHFPLSFYAYVSSRCLSSRMPVMTPEIRFYAETITGLVNDTTTVTESSHIYNIKHLLELGLNRYVASEVKILVESATKKRVMAYLLGGWLNHRKLFYLSQKLIVTYFPDQMLLVSFDNPVYLDLTRLVFPMAYREIVEQWAEETGLSPEWLWAIMRQESRFNPMAVSVAGAIGLMQIIPPTAGKIAKKIYYYFDTIDLFNPDVNVMLASYYLKFLFKQFNDPVFVAAAYNAGEDNVDRWRKQINYSCIDEWVEEIPFDETRKYVKKVIGNWLTYNFLKRIAFYEASGSY